MEEFGVDLNNSCMTPEQVATVMIELVRNGKYEGGTVLEVMKGQGFGVSTRVLPLWNVSAPESDLGAGPADEEVNYRRIREILGTERKGSD